MDCDEARSAEFIFIFALKPLIMAPKHAWLFDLPVRYVLGTGVATGLAWTMLRPRDVALAQETVEKPKVLVRTASGAVRNQASRTLPSSRASRHRADC